MRIDIISICPEWMQSYFEYSIMKRAIEKNIVAVHFHNLRAYATNKYRQVDDYQFGGGAGMVLMIEPIARCIEKLKKERNYDEIIYMCPDAPFLSQKTANTLSLKENIMILCGHYKGIDQRIRDIFITQEISIGAYVLSSGELSACVLCDAIIRLIPNVLSDETSALTDSFQDDLLAAPIYTRPANWNGYKVPDVLLSGNTAKIDQWKEAQAESITKKYLSNQQKNNKPSNKK